MEESILTSIKKLLGIAEENTFFDTDLIIDINTVLSILNQMGVGNSHFSISDSTYTWNDFIPNIDESNFNMVKNYIAQKVRLLFDSNLSSTTLQAINSNLSDLEFRLFSESNFTGECDD